MVTDVPHLILFKIELFFDSKVNNIKKKKNPTVLIMLINYTLINLLL
jgi:hypothetical protein